ncbi:unnamed protein product, partial [Phaeothamnion confervicola]
MKLAILSDSVVTPLGIGSEINFLAIQNGKSGIALIENSSLSDVPFYGSYIHEKNTLQGFTRFENITIQSVEDALKKSNQDFDLIKTAFVLATTKGNIELLSSTGHNSKDLLLHHTANKIAKHLGIEKSFVVSNACASGVMAVMLGKQLLEAGSFQHVIVSGTDVLSKFVVSGFQSLHALSDEPSK